MLHISPKLRVLFSTVAILATVAAATIGTYADTAPEEPEPIPMSSVQEK